MPFTSNAGVAYEGVAFGSNSITEQSRFVAVGNSGTSAYSNDGITWNAVTLPTQGTWVGVSYYDNQFVAVSSNTSNGATSTDGITWTLRSLSTSSNWSGLISKTQAYTARTPVSVPAQPVTSVSIGDASATTFTTDGITWTSATSIIGGTWSSGIYSDKFVAISPLSSEAIYSTNGVSWNLSNKMPDAFWAFLHGETTLRYVASNGSNLYFATHSVAAQTPSAISTDGITWTAASRPSLVNAISTLGYGHGRFVIPPQDGATSIGYTSTNGITWTPYTVVGAIRTVKALRSFAYGKSSGGQDLMVGVATRGSDNSLVYSHDALSWFGSTMPFTSNAGVAYEEVAFGSNSITEQSRFVAVGNSGTSAYSNDGITWNAVTLPTQGTWVGVSYYDNQFVAVSSNTSNGATSTDGITWTLRSLSTSSNWSGLISKTQAYTARTPVSVPAQPVTSVSIGDASATTFTTDGITWTSATSIIGGTWSSGIYSDKFVAIGPLSSEAIYSTNGVSWNLSNKMPDAFWAFNHPATTLRYIASNGSNLYLAVRSGSSIATSSTDAITWTAASIPATATAVTTIGYGHGRFVIANNTTTTNQLSHSTNGTTWTNISPVAVRFNINQFSYDSSSNIMVGVGNIASSRVSLTRSTDGTTWTTGTMPALGAITAITYNSVSFGNGKFVAVGTSGAAAYSTDGITWTSVTLPTQGTWIGVTYADSKFVAVSSNTSSGATSTDGATWTARTLSTSSNWSILIGKTDIPVVEGPVARGVFGGGTDGVDTNVMDYITIDTLGNATDFGDLTVARSNGLAACSSTTRGVFGGGFAGANSNVMDYITIDTLGNAIDFGDLTVARRNLAACSSTTRGVFGGGFAAAYSNVMDYITIATTGNATDFGDLTVARNNIAACSSVTRGVFGGGFTGSNSNAMDYITIATTGNATSFGSLSLSRRLLAACSSTTRGVFGGGNGTQLNVIDYITIATTGNATDFGDLSSGKDSLAGCSSTTRGVFGGGSGLTNVIDYITIATTGNATDFGDLIVGRSQLAALSNSHGGLG
jgi:hypothetical protein